MDVCVCVCVHIYDDICVLTQKRTFVCLCSFSVLKKFVVNRERDHEQINLIYLFIYF